MYKNCLDFCALILETKKGQIQMYKNCLDFCALILETKRWHSLAKLRSCRRSSLVERDVDLLHVLLAQNLR